MLARRARALAVLLTTFALLAAACGGGDDPTMLDREGDGAEATTEINGNGGDGAKGGDSSENDAGTGSGQGDSGDSGGGDGGDGSSGSAAGEPGSPAPTGGDGSNGGGSSTDGGQQPVTAPTAPGRYTYDVEGEVRAGEFNQPAPPEATLDVEPVQGSDQRTVSKHGDQESEQVLRFGRDGVSLVLQRSTSPGGTLEFRPEPPVLVFPAQPAEGAAWSWSMTSTDGSTTVDADLRILRRETITVAGASVETWVLRIDMRISGQITATSETTAWVSPEHRLRVQEESTIEGTFGQIPFEGEERRVIRSLTPA